MSEERKLRFKIRRADGSEIELEGDVEYVRQKYEELMAQLPASPQSPQTAQSSTGTASQMDPAKAEELVGLIERSSDGKIHFIFNADLLSAKEAVALMIFIHYPNPLTYTELSDMLGTGWKAAKEDAVRARASELRKEGRLLVESGRYSLSGSGIQWIKTEVIPRIKSHTQ